MRFCPSGADPARPGLPGVMPRDRFPSPAPSDGQTRRGATSRAAAGGAGGPNRSIPAPLAPPRPPRTAGTVRARVCRHPIAGCPSRSTEESMSPPPIAPPVLPADHDAARLPLAPRVGDRGTSIRHGREVGSERGSVRDRAPAERSPRPANGPTPVLAKRFRAEPVDPRDRRRPRSGRWIAPPAALPTPARSAAPTATRAGGSRPLRPAATSTFGAGLPARTDRPVRQLASRGVGRAFPRAAPRRRTTAGGGG